MLVSTRSPLSPPSTPPISLFLSVGNIENGNTVKILRLLANGMYYVNREKNVWRDVRVHGNYLEFFQLSAMAGIDGDRWGEIERFGDTKVADTFR